MEVYRISCSSTE